MIVSDEDLLLQGAHVGGQDVQPVPLVAHLVHVDVHRRHVLVASSQSWVLKHTHTHHTHKHRLQLVFLITCSLTNTGYSISHDTFTHKLQLVFLITCLLTNTCYSWYFSLHIHLPTHLPTDIGYSQYFS